jgi:hypothetical protein
MSALSILGSHMRLPHPTARIFFLLLLTSGSAAQAQSTPPLPLAALIQRASTQQTNYARVRQRYHCYYNAHGGPTRDEFGYISRIYESFFYKGREVTRTIALGNHRLADDLKPAEQQRVDKQELLIDGLPETNRPALPGGTSYENSKGDWQDSIEAAILRTAKFSNEHRIDSQDRSLIEVDFQGDQINQHLRRRELGTDAEAVAAYTAGSVQFDEQDGALVHLHGEVKQRVVTNGRILADPRMKIDYRATRINGELYVPSLWSDGKIETGGGLAKNKTAWFIYSTDTVELVGCEEEHVTSIIHTTPTN